ncbi:hypothetical protein APC61_05905 [Acinetobacter baumannii]|nr:hypothetical protein APC61_05905 [Acinetobacter baumannii]MBN6187834.1 hypothetical protein [Aneurinibacillus sp. BA2021]
MQKGHLVKLALDALKKRLADNNNVIEIYSGEGYVSPAVFTFNLPIDKKQKTSTIEEKPHFFKKWTLLNRGFIIK